MNNKQLFLKKIKDYKDLIIYKDCYFKDFNTFHVNNLIETLIIVKSVNTLKKILFDLNQYELEYVIIGNGSKILFKDMYVKKIVIVINNNFENISLDSDYIYASSGTNLAKIISFGHLYNLGGMEKLIGIPASLGGAIYKNAGAYDLAISDFIISVDFIDEFNNFQTIDNRDCAFSYRYSIFQKKKKWTIVGAKLKLSPIDINESKQIIKETILNRTNKQPHNHHNCGSIFKNPIGYKSADLIDKCNLKGLKINDAMISNEHANFIVNLNNAKPADIIKLIEEIEKNVYEKFKIKLELELEIIT